MMQQRVYNAFLWRKMCLYSDTRKERPIWSTLFICWCFVNDYHHPNEYQKADDVLVRRSEIFDEHGNRVRNRVGKLNFNNWVLTIKIVSRETEQNEAHHAYLVRFPSFFQSRLQFCVDINNVVIDMINFCFQCLQHLILQSYLFICCFC